MKRALVAAAIVGGVVLAAFLWPRGGTRRARAPERVTATTLGRAPKVARVAPPPVSKIYWPRRRMDKVSVAGVDPSPAPGAAVRSADTSGKPRIVEAPIPGPTDEDLRADQQRRRALREMGIDAPNPRLERPNGPPPPRPGRPQSP